MNKDIIKLRAKEVMRISLNPNEEITGKYNLSSRYNISSGFYLIALGSNDFDFKSSYVSTGENDDNELLSLSSSTYLVDIDVEQQKVLYIKELN